MSVPGSFSPKLLLMLLASSTADKLSKLLALISPPAYEQRSISRQNDRPGCAPP